MEPPTIDTAPVSTATAVVSSISAATGSSSSNDCYKTKKRNVQDALWNVAPANDAAKDADDTDSLSTTLNYDDESFTEESSPMDDDDDDDDDGGKQSDEETEIAQALVRAAFSRTQSTPALDQLFRNAYQSELRSPPVSKRVRRDGQVRQQQKPKHPRNEVPLSPVLVQLSEHPRQVGRAPSLRISESAPNLSALLAAAEIMKKKCEATNLPQERPEDCLARLLQPRSSSCNSSSSAFLKIRHHAAAAVPGFFEKLDDRALASYDLELVRAVRDEDATALRRMHLAGKSLRAGNRFGETVLHTACRRGSLEVVRYLLRNDAGGHRAVRACCDHGRTPLHDACWTREPNFAALELLLDACPDCLYVADRRGFTPLQYVPPKVHPHWCRFLERMGAERLRPRILELRFET